MRRIVALFLLAILICGPVLAATGEAQGANFWQEFDITFWQTAPFAVFWGYVIRSQFFPGSTDWVPIVNGALVVSLSNAFFHAKKVSGRSR